jgi:hypothetical protein
MDMEEDRPRRSAASQDGEYGGSGWSAQER